MVEDDRDVVYKCLLLLVKTAHYEVARNLAISQLKLKEKDAERIFQKAKKELIRSAEVYRDDEFGLAVQTCRELIATNFKIKDYKTALATRRELNRLLGLYVQSTTAEESEVGQETESATLAAIREHLEPLGLAPEGTDLVELARLAAIKVTEK